MVEECGQGKVYPAHAAAHDQITEDAGWLLRVGSGAAVDLGIDE